MPKSASKSIVLERMSRRRSIVFIIFLIFIQIVYFSIGAFFAPSPSFHQVISSTICKTSRNVSSFTYLKPRSNCEIIEEISLNLHVSWDELTFLFHIPLPRENYDLRLSRWMQTLTAVLEPQIDDDARFKIESSIKLSASLGYRDNSMNDWHVIQSIRDNDFNLKCTEFGSYHLFCDPIILFKLHLIHHESYLLNIKLNDEAKAGKLTGFNLITIYDTPGFVRLWLYVKSVTFIVVSIAYIWIRRNAIGNVVLQRYISVIGLATIFFNLPLEWLTLCTNFEWIHLLSDIVQGTFVIILLSFWIVFLGEHLPKPKSFFNFYASRLIPLYVSSACLLIFAALEQTTQLHNPFKFIWNSDSYRTASFILLILSIICFMLYTALLVYTAFLVIQNLRRFKLNFPYMNQVRRLAYQGLTFRFYIMLCVTVLCAILTVMAVIISRWTETLRFLHPLYEPSIQYASALYFAVYGMWNLYVMSMIVLYAPVKSSYTSEDDIAGLIDDAAEITRNGFELPSVLQMSSKLSLG